MKDRYLRLIDQDDEMILYLSKEDAHELATSLMYTIDYRDEEYPEFAALKDALFGWLSAQS